MIYLGIDPGVTGAYALFDANTNTPVARRYPGSIPAVLEELKSYAIDFAVLEHVHSSPIMGKKSAFSFGRNYGNWEGVLSGLGIRYIEITPQRWQKTIFDSVRRGTSKELSVAFVNKRFNLNLRKSHHNEADAICIALYASQVLLVPQGGHFGLQS